jgi:hypothetical protein
MSRTLYVRIKIIVNSEVSPVVHVFKIQSSFTRIRVPDERYELTGAIYCIGVVSKP